MTSNDRPVSLEESRARREETLTAQARRLPSARKGKHLLTMVELPRGGVGLKLGPTAVDLTDDQVEVVSAFLQTYLARRGGER